MNQLNPGAKWLFRVRAYLSFIPILFFLFLISIVISSETEYSGFILFITFVLIVVVFGEIYARMSYNRWFYEFTDEQLRLERGIIWKRYSNLPYERVQNVDITRGIIARMFGFSSVNIQTAGYSYTPKGGVATEGYIPAVNIEEAEHIREFIMKKITKRGRRQGL